MTVFRYKVLARANEWDSFGWMNYDDDEATWINNRKGVRVLFLSAVLRWSLKDVLEAGSLILIAL